MELLSDVNGDIGEKDAERETGTGSDPLAELAWGCDPVNGDPRVATAVYKVAKVVVVVVGRHRRGSCGCRNACVFMLGDRKVDVAAVVATKVRRCCTGM